MAAKVTCKIVTIQQGFVHMHIYIYTHTHTYIHTYTQRKTWKIRVQSLSNTAPPSMLIKACEQKCPIMWTLWKSQYSATPTGCHLSKTRVKQRAHKQDIIYDVAACHCTFIICRYCVAQAILTHCGRVTQICVYVLKLWKMDDAHLRF